MAVEGNRFIVKFQLRTEYTEKVIYGIGNIGYAVRVSEWGKRYCSEILRRGLDIAKSKGMDKVYLNINSMNTASIRLCEKSGGTLIDATKSCNQAEGCHRINRYIIYI